MATKLSFVLVIVAMLVPSMASAIVLTASFDSWIRDEGITVNDRDGDFVTASSTTSVFLEERYGILEFDLSSVGVPITSAHLQLWNQLNGAGDDGSPADQTATLINGTWVSPATGGSLGVGVLDWAGIGTAVGAGTLLTTMGDINISAHVSIPANVNGGTYVNTSADAGDLTALNADRTSDQLSTFVLIAKELGGSNSNTWGDENTFHALLTINEAPVADPIPPFGLSVSNWVRSDGPHVGDGVIVCDVCVDSIPSVGFMEWDLNHPDFQGKDPADLIGATLQLFAADNDVRNENLGQTAKQIDLNGTTVAAISSTPSYNAEYGAFGNALEGLGVVPDGTGAFTAGDSILTVATAADLQLVRDVMNGTQLLSLEFRGETPTSEQYWSDGIFGLPEWAPILTLTFVGDIQDGDFNKDGNITTADYDIMREFWLTDTSPAFNEDGELTSDGLVNLDDFSAFKALFPGGASAFAAAALAAANAVPEPSSLLLLLAAVPAWLVARPRRRTFN